MVFYFGVGIVTEQIEENLWMLMKTIIHNLKEDQYDGNDNDWRKTKLSTAMTMTSIDDATNINCYTIPDIHEEIQWYYYNCSVSIM